MTHLTRWSDNDMYGHLNNAKYYELFDTTINTWIAEHTGGDFAHKAVIGVVAESACRFHSELSFPGYVTVGLRVQRLGNSSVVYEIGIFDGERPDPTLTAAATGRWVHVYIDRTAKSTVPIPEDLRGPLGELEAQSQA
ncbi:thioesterase family protein [Nocardioides sp.]|uniref:acyl-CoA thioesterase n=1 Tax=Nocardioides sp. TaxID=35761 RepID=UPI002607D331|nr:thioesterase family protein [Nocardioides sp.]